MTRHTSRQGDRAGPVLEVLTLRQTSFRELLLVAFVCTLSGSAFNLCKGRMKFSSSAFLVQIARFVVGTLILLWHQPDRISAIELGSRERVTAGTAWQTASEGDDHSASLCGDRRGDVAFRT
jgi:hypothetical protein